MNLSVFKEYWREIEDVDGRGDLKLTLGGPWSAPLPEGSLTIRDAFVRSGRFPSRSSISRAGWSCAAAR